MKRDFAVTFLVASRAASVAHGAPIPSSAGRAEPPMTLDGAHRENLATDSGFHKLVRVRTIEDNNDTEQIVTRGPGDFLRALRGFGEAAKGSAPVASQAPVVNPAELKLQMFLETHPSGFGQAKQGIESNNSLDGTLRAPQPRTTMEHLSAQLAIMQKPLSRSKDPEALKAAQEAKAAKRTADLAHLRWRYQTDEAYATEKRQKWESLAKKRFRTDFGRVLSEDEIAKRVKTESERRYALPQQHRVRVPEEKLSLEQTAQLRDANKMTEIALGGGTKQFAWMSQAGTPRVEQAASSASRGKKAKRTAPLPLDSSNPTKKARKSPLGTKRRPSAVLLSSQSTSSAPNSAEELTPLQLKFKELCDSIDAPPRTP